MNATEKSLKQLAQAVRIESTFGAKLDWDKQSEWQQQSNGYSCTLHYQGRQYTFDFWQGQAHTSDPTAEGCLECLLSDASSVDNAADFADWCGEMGYDTDSRKAEAMYKACEKEAENVKRLLGDDYETFLYAERD